MRVRKEGSPKEGVGGIYCLLLSGRARKREGKDS